MPILPRLITKAKKVALKLKLVTIAQSSCKLQSDSSLLTSGDHVTLITVISQFVNSVRVSGQVVGPRFFPTSGYLRHLCFYFINYNPIIVNN